MLLSTALFLERAYNEANNGTTLGYYTTEDISRWVHVNFTAKLCHCSCIHIMPLADVCDGRMLTLLQCRAINLADASRAPSTHFMSCALSIWTIETTRQRSLRTRQELTSWNTCAYNVGEFIVILKFHGDRLCDKCCGKIGAGMISNRCSERCIDDVFRLSVYFVLNVSKQRSCWRALILRKAKRDRMSWRHHTRWRHQITSPDVTRGIRAAGQAARRRRTEKKWENLADDVTR